MWSEKLMRGAVSVGGGDDYKNSLQIWLVLKWDSAFSDAVPEHLIFDKFHIAESHMEPYANSEFLKKIHVLIVMMC